MCESFFIVPINDSHELPETEAEIGATEHVNFTKTKKSRELVEFEEGFDEYNPTIEEVIKFLLLRGAGRFSKEELPYFCQELGRDPSYDIDEGRDKKYATTSTIRAQLATWKKNFVQDSMPLSSEAVSNLQETLDNMGVTPTTELT